MSACQGVPCLLFFKTDDESDAARKPACSSAQPTFKGYVLLPPAFKEKHPEILETFSRDNLLAIPEGPDEPSPKKKKLDRYTLQLFEAQIYSVTLVGAPFYVSIGVYCQKQKMLGYLKPVPHCLKSLNPKVFNFSSSKDIHYSEQLDDTNLKAIEALVSQGANIEYGHHKSGTIIHFAIKRRQETLLKLLFRNRANTEAQWLNTTQSHFCSRLFILAVKKEARSIVDLILSYQATLDPTVHSDLKKLLEQTLSNDRLESFRFVLELKIRLKNCVPYDTIFEYLRMSVGFKAEAFVKLLLHHCPVDVFFKPTDRLFQHPFERGSVAYTTILFGALSNDWYEVVRKFVEEGADVNQELKLWDVQPLGERPSHPNPRNELLRGDRDLLGYIQGDLTPLSLAAACAGEAVITLLLKHGAEVNVELWSSKRTPIHCACYFNNLNAVRLLIAGRANIWQYPELLSTAVKRGNAEIVELLLLNGIVSSVEDSEFQKCVSLAVCTANIKIMEILFRFGAQLNAHDVIECTGRNYWRTHQNFMKTVLDHCFTTCDVSMTEIIPYNYHWTTRLVCYVIKRESAQLCCRQQDVSPFWRATTHIETFRSDSEAEVEKLRTERVGGLDATFYDVLTKNVYQLAGYAKHPDFVAIMRTRNYNDIFPIYASVLDCQFEKAARRQELLSQVTKLGSNLGERFSNLLNIINQGTFEIIVEEILKNLSNFDLEILSYRFNQLVCKENDE